LPKGVDFEHAHAVVIEGADIKEGSHAAEIDGGQRERAIELEIDIGGIVDVGNVEQGDSDGFLPGLDFENFSRPDVLAPF
jgi:hypothetical protein